jgi:Putative peptidoglycan binding domain
MAKFSTRQVVIIAVAVLAAAAATAGVAMASGGSKDSPASSSGGGSLSTAAVVRTDLINTVQVGGSIGYNNSYTITAPSPGSSSTLTADQQAVTSDQAAVPADQQTLAGDQQAATDGTGSGSQTTAADQADVTTDQSLLRTDQAKENYDCANTSSTLTGPETQACASDKTQVRTDQATLAAAQQKLAADQQSTRTSGDGARAKVAADQVKLHGDQAKLANDQTTLASLAATAANPGTTYTWLPKTGQVIKEDQAVYTVSSLPVPLLYGSIAAYRPFETGMSDGPDVGELTHDLISLGYGAGLTQSDHFTSATAAAVARWQHALGLPATGKILLGDVVFEPGPIRVTTVTPATGEAVGGASGGSTVLTATATTPVVTVALAVTQEYLVKPGDTVSVVLPDGTTTVGGQVETVGDVAVCPSGSSTGTGNSPADQSPCSSSGSGSSSTPTVTVTISLDSTPPGATLDQAPVNVNITSQRADNVLAVPVNALLALAGGGYAVQVVTGSTSHLAAVTTGLYSSTLVQVSGAGITAGTLVEVPSS